MTSQRPQLTVAIAGLGAIGLPLARALDAGVSGLRLVAVSARDRPKAAMNLAGFQSLPRIDLKIFQGGFGIDGMPDNGVHANPCGFMIKVYNSPWSPCSEKG